MGTLPPMSFGALLKHYRQARHLTQETLAEQARLSTNAINSLERGVRQRPYPNTVARLAEALELSREERKHFEVLARRTLLTNLPDPSLGRPVGVPVTSPETTPSSQV